MIKCQIEGCQSEFKNPEPLAPGCRYICSKHTRAEQWKAVGREQNERKDTLDTTVRFQDCQFDKDLKRGRRAIETEHIAHQGSDIYDQQEQLGLQEKHPEGVN